MNRKYVFFDFDGTLVDTSQGIINTVSLVLERYGIKEPDKTVLHTFIGPPLTDSFARHYHFPREQIDEAVRIFRKHYNETGIHESEPYPGISDVLQILRGAGFSCVVTSSKPEAFLHFLLKRFEIDQYFDCIIGATMDGSRILKEDIIRLAMEQNNVNPGEAIVVGDHPLDIRGAHACGLESCAALYGFGDKHELAETKPEYTVERPEDIPDAVTQWKHHQP